jgi:hypothetical protein
MLQMRLVNTRPCRSSRTAAHARVYYARRAYPGVLPVIPHAIDDDAGGAFCLFVTATAAGRHA